jgi:hypothetical protein
MTLATEDLPSDSEELRALLLAERATHATELAPGIRTSTCVTSSASCSVPGSAAVRRDLSPISSISPSRMSSRPSPRRNGKTPV